MSLNGNEIVVADKKMFAGSLGVPESVLDGIINKLAFYTIFSLIGAIVAFLLHQSLVITIFGLTIVVASGLLGAIVGGVLWGLGIGVIVYRVLKWYKKKFGDTIKIKIEFSGSLRKIGMIVADVVFVPAVCLAKMDWGDDKQHFILDRLKEWGYDEEWSKRFLQELSGSSGDILDRTIQRISKKDLGGIKDKTVTRYFLIGHAEKLLNNVKQEFVWDQVAVEERKAAIVKRMKEGSSNRFTWRALLCPWRRAERDRPHWWSMLWPFNRKTT